MASYLKGRGPGEVEGRLARLEAAVDELRMKVDINSKRLIRLERRLHGRY